MIQGQLTMGDAVVVALSGAAIVFLMLALLWGIIVIISKVIGSFAAKPAAMSAAPAPAATAPSAAMPAAAAAAPQVALQGVSEPEAACIMAIVSHETGIPLNQLVFTSIKAK